MKHQQVKADSESPSCLQNVETTVNTVCLFTFCSRSSSSPRLQWMHKISKNEFQRVFCYDDDVWLPIAVVVVVAAVVVVVATGMLNMLQSATAGIKKSLLISFQFPFICNFHSTDIKLLDQKLLHLPSSKRVMRPHALKLDQLIQAVWPYFAKFHH